MAQGYISRRNRIKSSDTYRVRLYRYGQIWKTINVIKGNAVTLTACDVAYDDDKFYGWSTDPQSVTRSYAPTATFRPTTNLNLYAIFSYIQNSTVQQSKSVSATLDQDQTLTVTDATVGTAYTITMTTPTSITQGKTTSPSTGYVTYFPIISTTQTVLQSGTTTSSTITYSASKGTSISGGALSGTSSPSSAPKYNNITAYPSIKIDYITTITQTGTKYRVASHDIESKINIFVYGELTKTVSIKEGLSTTIGEVISQYSDDTFYGYSTEPNSTTLTYQAASNIEPHGEMNLYAIFSYEVAEEHPNLSIDVSSSGNQSVGNKTYNVEDGVFYDLLDGTITLAGTEVEYSSSGGGDSTKYAFKELVPPLSDSNYGMMVQLLSSSGSIVTTFTTDNISQSVSKGQKLKIMGRSYSYSDGNHGGGGSTYYCKGTIPAILTINKYRVSAHI